MNAWFRVDVDLTKNFMKKCYQLYVDAFYCTDFTVLHIDHYKLIVKPFCYGQFSFFKTLFLCHVNRYKQNLFSQSELHTRKSKAYAANCSYSHYTIYILVRKWLFKNAKTYMTSHIEFWCKLVFHCLTLNTYFWMYVKSKGFWLIPFIFHWSIHWIYWNQIHKTKY